MKDALISSSGPSRRSNIPFLRSTATSKQLIVDGVPFMMRAGELQNSSMSSAEHMRSIWPQLVKDHLNTVLGSVAWEQIEPSEGHFDFQELGQCIQDAREAGLRLVLLWFGSFKNGLSTYVPGWVKTNATRFPRVKLRDSRGHAQTADILSLFDTELLDTETAAFSGLMQFLADFDSQHHTVIMVQVENEVGVLGDSRDASTGAEDAFSSPVPQDLARMLRDNWETLSPSLKSAFPYEKLAQDPDSSRNWVEVFGDSVRTDELFMAYHYSSYVERVAAAGKRIHPVPFYTNVWQNYGAEDRDKSFPAIVGGGSDPGVYPSGGGVINVLDIWQLLAPSLDFIAPDIYLNEYDVSCAKYRHRGQPLFIPEQRRDEYGARRIWTAFATHMALGTSPFGIDTVCVEHGVNPFAKHYALLEQCSYHLLAAQGRSSASFGFYFDEPAVESTNEEPKQWTATFGEWTLTIERSFVFGRPAAGYGMVIQLQPEQPRFLLVGRGFQVTFKSNRQDATFSGILNFKEMEVTDPRIGQMRCVRWLNGDETRSGKFAIMPSEDPDYGGFPISVTIPAGTGIAEVEPYALYE